MNITADLLRDHEQFYEQFDGLEQALLAPAGAGQVAQLVAELDASLALHARLEDELLFASLEPIIGQAGPLGVMRMEHDEIESTLAQLQRPVDLAHTEAAVRHLLEVARPHFMKEEQILFPMSEQVLRSEELERLGAEFEARRGREKA